MAKTVDDLIISSSSSTTLSDVLRKRLWQKNDLSTDSKEALFEQYPGISYFNESQDREMIRVFNDRWNSPIRSDLSLKLESFSLIRTLGEGSFGRVLLAKYQKNQPDNYIALKMLSKRRMLGKNQAHHVINEKRLMWACVHPHIVPLICCFKDNSNLYLGIEYQSGGDLFYQLRRARKFTEWVSKFFASQVFMALEYLHTMDVLYRDLKPENIMVTETGYIKLGDLGFAKQVTRATRTFCGTPEYLAPEIIMHRSYGKSVDWWSFGILLFELNAGVAPFVSRDQNELFQKICKERIRWPMHFSSSLKNLISGLLIREVSSRCGCMPDGSKDIKNHRWFSDINLSDVFFRRLESPHKLIPSKNYRSRGEHPITISITSVGDREFENF